MDNDSVTQAAKVKVEQAKVIKDGYVQLAEKVEQVKNQVAKMERKYDELYQTVKEKEVGGGLNANVDTESPEESHKEISVAETSDVVAEEKVTEESPPNPTPSGEKEEVASKKGPSNIDIEKLENNPFV